MQKITNSSTETFLLCRRKHYYSYVKCIKPRWEGWPLFDGKVYHDAQHQYYSGVSEENVLLSIDKQFDSLDDQGFDTLKNKALVRGMFRGYACIYAADEFEDIEPEVSFSVEVPSAAIEGKSFIIAGKTDARVRRNVKPYLLEHKTTSEASITRYLETLNLADQPNFYLYGYNREMKNAAIGVIYRIVVKSKIRQLKAETEDAFLARLEQVYIDDAMKPEELRKHYFEETIYRSPAEQAEWFVELCQKAANMDNYFPYKSTGQCYHWGKACEFNTLCQGGDIGENFVKKSSQHEELE